MIKEALDSISSIFTNFILLMIVGSYLVRFRTVRMFAKTLVLGVVLVSLVWHVVTALGYLYTPLFFDHVELNIAAVAKYWQLGNPIYTLPDAASRYSLLYGPWPYLVNAIFQAFGSGVYFLSKLPGVMNFIILIGGFYLSIRNLKISDRFLSLGALCSTLLIFYHYSYWNRPDSFLTTYAFLALMFVVFNKKIGDLATYLGVAVLCGISANCKIHGVLYFVPIVFYFFESSGKKINWRYVAMGTFLALAGLVLPFLIKNVGAENYLVWIKLASKHGLDAFDFIKNTTFIICFLLLLFVLKFHKQYRWTYGALCIAGFLVAVAASKPGAGTHHFMPFVPVIMYFAIQAYFSGNGIEVHKLGLIAAAFLISMGFEAHHRQRRVVKLFNQTAERQAELKDFEKLLHEIPGPLEMGYSSSQNYDITFFRLTAVAEGRAGLLMEGAALMDMHESGMDIPEATIAKIKSCDIPTFVFPVKGDLWTLNSYYREKPLYTQQFRDVFAETYSKTGETDNFAIYTCKHK